MLIDVKDYYEEDIEQMSSIEPYEVYGKSYKGTRNGYFKGKDKVLNNGAKGGLVKSYRKYPLWSDKMKKVIDKVDEVIAREIKK